MKYSFNNEPKKKWEKYTNENHQFYFSRSLQNKRQNVLYYYDIFKNEIRKKKKYMKKKISVHIVSVAYVIYTENWFVHVHITL